MDRAARNHREERKRRKDRAVRGLTLMEVVIALMLFALISVMLVGSHDRAADATLRAGVQRDIAELVGFRINMVVLQPNDYEDGDTGRFPDSGASTRLVDEEEIFGDRYAGYTWELEMVETIGAGATNTVSLGDGEPRNLLFEEEGGSVDEGAEEAEAEAKDVDRMLFIRVTVYPPGYDQMVAEDEEAALKPRSAWTAIQLPGTGEEDG